MRRCVNWLTKINYIPFAKAAIALTWASAGVPAPLLYDFRKCVHPQLYICAVATGRPTEYDIEEPKRVAEAIHKMGVKHAVITSVNRDELKDRGAEIWYQTVVQTKALSPETTIETLIPDTKGNWDALYHMIEGGQEVVSHNMETVGRLYRMVRPQAKYERSLEQIKRIREAGKRTKSGIMLGVGETKEEVFKAMDDLAANGLMILTLGQYLQPTKMHLEVAELFTPIPLRCIRKKV
ncbi:MAG: lipoyl synthase [Bacteroidetes bacterium OLB12]|nr:MAG: lipoyl synthase [Bacteroidetes bacterium OLB12]